MQLIHKQVDLHLFQDKLDKLSKSESYTKLKAVQKQQLRSPQPKNMMLNHNFTNLYGYFYGLIKSHLEK